MDVNLVTPFTGMHTHTYFLLRSGIPLTCFGACIDLELGRIGETCSSGLEYH